MNREKQIEEMAKQLYGNFGLSMPTARNVATYLTEKKDYRKASDVAREIFEEIEKLAKEGGVIWTNYASAVLNELKKKYTEEGK